MEETSLWFLLFCCACCSLAVIGVGVWCLWDRFHRSPIIDTSLMFVEWILNCGESLNRGNEASWETVGRITINKLVWTLFNEIILWNISILSNNCQRCIEDNSIWVGSLWLYLQIEAQRPDFAVVAGRVIANVFLDKNSLVQVIGDRQFDFASWISSSTEEASIKDKWISWFCAFVAALPKPPQLL